MYRCLSPPSLTALLDADAVTWKYYAVGNKPIWVAPNAIRHMCDPVVSGKCTGAGWKNVVLNPPQILTDIQHCNLANVVWVTPSGQYSGHPNANKGPGPA